MCIKCSKRSALHNMICRAGIGLTVIVILVHLLIYSWLLIADGRGTIFPTVPINLNGSKQESRSLFQPTHRVPKIEPPHFLYFSQPPSLPINFCPTFHQTLIYELCLYSVVLSKLVSTALSHFFCGI